MTKRHKLFPSATWKNIHLFIEILSRITENRVQLTFEAVWGQSFYNFLQILAFILPNGDAVVCLLCHGGCEETTADDVWNSCRHSESRRRIRHRADVTTRQDYLLPASHLQYVFKRFFLNYFRGLRSIIMEIRQAVTNSTRNVLVQLVPYWDRNN